MHTMLSERMGGSVSMLLDISDDDQNSQGVNLAGRPILGLIVPVTNGTPDITFEVSVDGGSSYVDLLEDDGSTAAITIAAGAAAFAVSSDDLSPLAGYACTAGAHSVLVRGVFSVAQLADRTLTWLVVA